MCARFDLYFVFLVHYSNADSYCTVTSYIGASIALTGSPDTFCNNPDLVATEGKYAWGAGLFFWMEHSKEGTTCHTESLKNLDFGGTLNNVSY